MPFADTQAPPAPKKPLTDRTLARHLVGGRELLVDTAKPLRLWRRYAEAGKQPTDEQSRAVLGKLVADGRDELRHLADGLADGKLSLERWHRLTRDNIVSRHVAAMLATSGTTRVSGDERAALLDRINVHLGYLDNFRAEITDGSQLLGDGSANRATYYADAVWATGMNARLDRGKASGATEAIRHLGASDHCFPAGTLVATDQGQRPIEDVTVGDWVLTRVGYRRATKTFSRWYVGTLCRVVAEDKSVLCTPNHPFLTHRGWVRADALIHGQDAVFLQDGLDLISDYVSVPDANDSVSTSGEIFVPSSVSLLLSRLAGVERFESRMPVPPFTVGFDDEFANLKIDDEFWFDQNLVFIGDIEAIEDGAEPGFDFARSISLNSGLAFQQFCEISRIRFEPYSQSVGGTWSLGWIINPHMFSSPIMDDLTSCSFGQADFQSVGFVDDLSVCLADSFCDPSGTVVGVVADQNLDFLGTPLCLSAGCDGAGHAEFGVEVFSPVTPGTNVATGARQTLLAAPQADKFCSLAAMSAMGTSDNLWPESSSPYATCFTGISCSIPAMAAVRTRAVGPMFTPLRLGSAHDPQLYEVLVFNLEVEGEHEYFANGFLVHNCQTCLDEAAAGWQPVDEVREIGDSECGPMCHCELTYR